MRTNLKPIALVLGLLLCAPLAALAEGESLSQMNELESRIMALEDRLATSEATVNAQRQVLHNANVSTGPMGQAGGGSIWDRVVVGGHIAGSYAYNFNNPQRNTGDVEASASGVPVPPFPTNPNPAALIGSGSQPFNQFNRNHNTFQVDAVKLEMGLPTNGPGTAGFQVDLLYGANEDLLCASNGGSDEADRNVCLQQAYMSYDWDGVELTFGKFETLLGYEVIDSPENHHITHGVLFTWAIPLTHTGLLAGGNFDENFGWKAGVVNGFNNAIDNNDNKGILGQLSYSDGPFSSAASVFWGSEEYRLKSNGVTVGQNKDYVTIVDVVLSYMADDATELWANVDYGTLDRDAANIGCVTPGPGTCFADPLGTTNPSPFNLDAQRSDPFWWGFGAGLAHDLDERSSFALRGEYFSDHNGARLGFGEKRTDYYTATGTYSYSLTERLMARVEARYDKILTDDDRLQPFQQNSGVGTTGANPLGDKNDAVTGIVEVSYSFD